MANDSSEAGYLLPTSAASYGDPLDDVLHDAVAGMTGIPGSLVRPRWQPEPPQQPSYTTDWVAFGVTRSSVDVFAYTRPGDSGETVERDEQLFVLHSFYGPNSHSICERFRDAFEVSQNRDALRASGITLVEVQEATLLPALLKEKWVKRVDVTVNYRRRTVRTFAVRTIQSAVGQIVTEDRTVPINVTHP